MSDPYGIIDVMNEWTNPNLINQDVIENLTNEQVDQLLEILSKVE